MNRFAWMFVLFLSLPAFADAPSFSYIRFGYQVTASNSKWDPSNNEQILDGSYEMNNRLHVFGSIVRASGEVEDQFEDQDFTNDLVLRAELDGWRGAVGIGTHFEANDTTVLYGQAALTKSEVDVEFRLNGEINSMASSSADYDGYIVGLGVRSFVNPSVEVSAGLNYFDIFDEENTSFYAAADYQFTTQVGLGLVFSRVDDDNTVGLRFTYYP